MVSDDFDGHCAYCERAIDLSDGISHFRPLSLLSEQTGDAFSDHYSWLAFEWFNLFLICRRCQRAKGVHFPVADGRARFLATFDEVKHEEAPLLIDPTSDNPSSHLNYLSSGECFPKQHSSKGRTTVELLDLNDRELIHERAEAIENAILVWRGAIEGRNELPEDFLLMGSFRGACRDVLRRSLDDFGIANPSINSGRAFLSKIQLLLQKSERDDRERMSAAIELLQNSDRSRRAELDRRTSLQLDGLVAVQSSAQPQARQVLKKGEIASLHVTNFRAIDDIEIPVPLKRSEKSGVSCLLLLGENSVGKSTCLSAVALALLGTRESHRLKIPYGDLARSAARDSWDVWVKKPVQARVYFDDRKSPAEFSYDPVRNRIEGTEDQSAVVLGYGPHRYFARSRGRRGTSAAQRVRSLFDPSQALPDPSDWLTSLRGFVFDEVARTIRTILPIGDDDHLVNDPRSGICVWAQGQLTPVGRLSEGYRSVFAMVADICRSLLEHWSNMETARGVVLIDEIETHLHPQWKMRVMTSLRRAFPNVQFIATTHDPLCLRGMEDDEVIVLTRTPDGGVGRLNDLPKISGMRAEQLLTSEYFGLSSTIDPDVQLDIARLAQGVATDPDRAIGIEAKELVSRLTVGDSATAQIIHDALLRYLREREQPTDGLSPNVRADAVEAVLQALRKSQAG